MKDFTAKAKRLLKKSKLTYSEVGLRMGFTHQSSRQQVYRFLNGTNPSAAMVAKFAKALDVPVEKLL